MEFIQQHWPFLFVAAIFWVVGHFTSTSVFTASRAAAPGRLQPLWYWGRESLELHPVAAGLFLGYYIWLDPEGAGWGPVESAAYFGGAGVFGLIFWKVLSIFLAKKGYDIGHVTMPGEDDPK